MCLKRGYPLTLKYLLFALILLTTTPLIANAQWIPAGQLAQGTILRTSNGVVVTVLSIQKKHGTNQMYNLTVNHNHDFFIGNSGDMVLVHNCSEEQKIDTIRRVRSSRWKQSIFGKLLEYRRASPNGYLYRERYLTEFAQGKLKKNWYDMGAVGTNRTSYEHEIITNSKHFKLFKLADRIGKYSNYFDSEDYEISQFIVRKSGKEYLSQERMAQKISFNGLERLIDEDPYGDNVGIRPFNTGRVASLDQTGALVYAKNELPYNINFITLANELGLERDAGSL